MDVKSTSPGYMSQKVVVASGYFDPLHYGHIEYLERSRDQNSVEIVMKTSYQLKPNGFADVSLDPLKEHAASCPLFSQDLGDKLLVIVNNDMQARTYETIFPYHISMLGGSMQIIQIWKAAQKKGQPFMPGAWRW